MNSALVIRAFARDYKSILDTIKKLDIYPKQVLIESFLADITLNDTYKFGIEWAKFVTTSSHKQGTEAQGVDAGSQPLTIPLTLRWLRGVLFDTQLSNWVEGFPLRPMPRQPITA